MKYRKKPVVIEAVQWLGKKSYDEVGMFLHGACALFHNPLDEGGFITIETLEGTMTANYGDWIIKGVKGEFYPCKPDIFAATYEPVQ